MNVNINRHVYSFPANSNTPTHMKAGRTKNVGVKKLRSFRNLEI
jgi:hypothetical protein